MVINERQEAVDWLLASYFNDPEPETRSEPVDPPNLSDQALLDKAFAAANGGKLARLWYGGDIYSYPSASEADLALASMLAFWTGPDPGRLERLMRSSKLVRDKWDDRHYGDGATYLGRLIDRALAGRTEFYAAGNHADGNSNVDPLTLLRALADSPTSVDIEAALRIVVNSLAGVDGLKRATLRQETLSILKAKTVNGAAKLVDAAWALIADKGGTDGDRTDFLADPEPWPEPVDGAILLDIISDRLRRYMVITKEQADTCALWTIFAHAHDAYQVSPLLAVQSPVMGCGKSRLQSILTPMLPRALLACNLTSATLFRTVEKYKPTLLIDEADTFMHDNEELRGIVNSGWLRSSAQTIRLVGDEHEPQTFSTWCPKVIAAIGKLPPTIQDRSIVIELKRKGHGETVKRFSMREANTLKPLCSQAARWAADNIDPLREATPEPPAHLGDRQADSWTPLLTIADLAGGDWPDRARAAALILSGGERDPEADGAGVMLIADCVTIFNDRGVDRLSTTDLINELVKIEERPWSEWNKGKQITPRGLAKLLKPFGIRPKVERVGDDLFRGYEAHAFDDACSRYFQGSNVLHPLQPNKDKDLDPNFNVLQIPDVTHTKSDLSIEKHRNVTHVTDKDPENGRNEDVEDETEVTDPASESRCAADMGDLFDNEEVLL